MTVRDHAGPCWWCGLPNVTAGSGPARVLELLQDDGGWWTAAAIAGRLGLTVHGARKIVHRYRAVLEFRVVYPAGRGRVFEYRWKGPDE